MYEKPKANVMEISKDDIIQTSPLDENKNGIIVDQPMEFSITAQSDATGNVFQK